MIDALDQGEYVHILGTNGNRTDLNVQLHPLNDPKKETIFENCVADVNIPVGEVFTSPVLEGTNGVLHVSKVYLNELQYQNLELVFTDGKITEIVDSFDADTVAAIANALYFSDSWSNQFLEENTTEGTFHGAKQDEDAEFMNQKLSDGIYYEDETMQAVVLWTTSGGQMVLCLPKDGYSAEEALQSLTTEKLQKISGADYRCVQLSLPKFKLESKAFSIKEALEAMGVPLMQATDAALTEVLDNEALYISSAQQSAMVEVDENGLTAAAVTVMGLEKMALMPETDPIELTFDSPFAFVLTGNGEDAGDQILFTGVVNHL